LALCHTRLCATLSNQILTPLNIYNFNGLKIPLPHNHVNIPELRRLMAEFGYPDTAVADFTEFGWPSGHLSSVVPKGSPGGNHASIRSNPGVLSDWIIKNLAKGTLSGPYEENPFCTDISIVPTGAVPKDIPGTFRIIHDLSLPPDDCLNKDVPRHTYLGDCFIVALATVDDIAMEIFHLKSLGHEVLLWGRDLKSCFRQILECPSSWHTQCFRGEDSLLYFDLTALMGRVTSEMKAMRLGFVPAFAHRAEGHFVMLYVDDYSGVDAAELAFASAASFDEKLSRLNLQQNTAKIEDPTSSKIVMGIEFDCVAMEMRLGHQKLHAIKQFLESWPPTKYHATLTEL
jgi:hypothetical protein